MDRFLITIIIVAVIPLSVAAQGRSVNQFEIGAGYAPVFLASADDSYEVPFKVDVFCEWRHNLGRFFDVGAKLDYKLSPASIMDRYAGFTYKGLQLYGALLAYTDLNLRPLKKVGFFAGLGFGPGMILNDWILVEENNPREGMEPQRGIGVPQYYLVIAPRIGIDLFHHLRLSMSVDMALADMRWPLCLNAGWTF